MKVHHGQQGTPEHFALRAGRATSTTPLLTPKTRKISTSAKPGGGAWVQALAERLTGGPLTDDSGVGFVRHVIHGSEAEPEARGWFSLAHGVDVDEVAGIETDDGTLWASPDGLVRDEERGLELKCPAQKAHAGYLWRPASLVESYEMQVQACMAVSGYPVWTLMSYRLDMPPVVVEVERDAELCEQILDAAREFDRTLTEAVAEIRGREKHQGVTDTDARGALEVFG